MSHEQLPTSGNGQVSLTGPNPEVTPKARRRLASSTKCLM